MPEQLRSTNIAVPDDGNGGQSANLCLRKLAPAIFAEIDPYLRLVETERDCRLESDGPTADAVIFPLSGIVSIVYGESETDGEGGAAAVAMIGREGIANYHLLFPSPIYPYTAIGHVSGEALAINTMALRALLLTNRGLRSMFYDFAARLHLQIASNLRASLRDSIDKRLARCLLMHHDRIGGDCISVYHSRIADMLGVRRASVTDAIHRLEGAKAIRDTRGQTQIRSRKILREIAGQSYGAAERTEQD